MDTEVALIKINPKEFGLEETQAVEITKGLVQVLAERNILAEKYAETIKLEITHANLKVFKELRGKIKDNRTKGIEVWHKRNKEFYLRGGQFVDAIKRKESAENERMEANLLENENYFERIEKERITNLQSEREALLISYEVENLTSLNLGVMSEQIWANFLIGCQDAFKTKKEAEAKLEQERLAAIETEKERLRIIEEENAKLKADAEIKERELSEERRLAKIESDKKEAELALERKAAQDKIDEEKRKAQSIADAAKLESDKKDKEIAEANRKAKELEAQREAETKDAIRIQEEAIKKANDERIAQEKSDAEAAKAPEKDKLTLWVNNFQIGRITGLEGEANAIALNIIEKFESYKKWALTQINNL